MILHAKGIKTIFSSANKKDIAQGYAHIAIDYDSLSEENRRIALTVGALGRIHGSEETQGVYINIPVTEDSTVGEVRKEAVRLSQLFREQP